MTNHIDLSARPALGWQLRAELRATSSRGGDRLLADQVTKIMQELELPPLRLERIRMAVLEAVQKVLFHRQSVKAISTVRLRIWVAGKSTHGRSWGFFLVEKPGNAPNGVSVEREYLVELFLYQERDS